MKKIYLAAPVFSTLERNVNKYIANKIENTGKYRVFLPQTVSPIKVNDEYDMYPIFSECKNNIIDSDLILAFVDGADVANNKKSICVRTDIRKSEGNGVNIMIEYGSTKTLYRTKYHQNMDDLINLIIKEIEEI